MAYEHHATMLIHRSTASVYACLLSLFATSSALTVIYSMMKLPPTDFFSLAFNLSFMCMVTFVFTKTLEIIHEFFFSDVFKEKLLMPICKKTTCFPNGIMENVYVFKQCSATTTASSSAVSVSETNNNECIKTKSPETPESECSDQADSDNKTTCCAFNNNNDEFIKTKCPETPDSERSNAGTEAGAVVVVGDE
jgi:hypothetical protein